MDGQPRTFPRARAMNGSMDTLTDAQVIALSMEEPQAFAHIFDRHFPVVRGYLARRVGPAGARGDRGS